MEFLYKRLPKDLVYIINDYARDKTQYNKVIDEFKIRYKRERYCISFPRDRTDDQKNTVIINYLLRSIKDERERKFNQWYEDCKKFKKPHGKKPPTIKSKSSRSIPRSNRRRRRGYCKPEPEWNNIEYFCKRVRKEKKESYKLHIKDWLDGLLAHISTKRFSKHN